MATLAPFSAFAADVPVELELVLSVDSSSSVKGPEFDLQVQGYASAFRNPEVIAAIRDLGSNGIAVTFVQWSASFQQVQTVGWSHLRSGADAHAFAGAIERQARQFTGFGTALGTAIQHAGGLFKDSGYVGWRRVIDISADETANTGSHPSHTREAVLAAGITINGLAIEQGSTKLGDYFREYVIGGPGAFVLTLRSYADFAEAIKRKLLREITTPLALLSPGEPELSAQ